MITIFKKSLTFFYKKNYITRKNKNEKHKKMEHIKIYIQGDIKITTICLYDLIVVMVKNEKNDGDMWFSVSRKVKSFKEIEFVETLKRTWKEAWLSEDF